MHAPISLEFGKYSTNQSVETPASDGATTSVAAPVVERLRDMGSPDGVGAVEIGDRPGHAADTVDAATGQAKARHRPLDQGQAWRIECAVLLEGAAREVGIRPAGTSVLAGRLARARLFHASANRRGRLARSVTSPA